MMQYMKKQPVITAIQFNMNEDNETLDFLSRAGISYSFSVSADSRFSQTILKIGSKTYEDGNEVLKNVNYTDYIVVETQPNGKVKVDVLDVYNFNKFYELKEEK